MDVHIATMFLNKRMVNFAIEHEPTVLVQHGEHLPTAEAKKRTAIEMSLSGLVAAIEAGDAQKAYALCNEGANLNGVNEEGDTPLHVAASARQSGIAQLLLLKGADKLIKNKAGQTASQLARSNGFHDVVGIIEDFEPSGAVLSDVIGKLDENIVKRFDGIQARLRELERRK